MASVWDEIGGQRQSEQPSMPIEGTKESTPKETPDVVPNLTFENEPVGKTQPSEPQNAKRPILTFGEDDGEQIPQGGRGTVSRTPSQTHALPTLFHQATIRQPGEKDLTVGETLRGAARNLVPSALGVVGTFTHALTHPAETLGAVGDIGTGLLSKAAGAAGARQDPAKKKQEERAVDAMWNHYKKTYFTSSQDFMRAFKNDPASILLDFSTLTGVGSAALPGKLGQAAKIAATVTDPIQSSLAVARGVGSVPAKALRGLQSTASNVPYNTLTDVYELARRGTPAQKTAFKDGRSFTEGQIVDEFADTITQVADDASAAYVANIEGLDKVKPDYNRVMQTLQKEENALRDSLGQIPEINQPAFNKIQDIRNRVLSYSSDPNHNLMFADRFKRNLNAERYNFPVTDPARNVIDSIKKEVRDTIASKDAKYANAMDQWQDWISQAKDIKNAIGQPNSGAANTMAKILKSMKSDLKRKNVIDVLAKKNERLPYLLAGYATNPMHKGNIGLMDALLSGAGWYAFAHPLGAVGTVGLASPRLSSVSQTALGKIGKYGAAATSRPVTAGAYYGERALQEEGQQPGQEEGQQPGYEYNVNYDDTFGRMLSTESGNQQFTKTGETITSPKGALGAAQIMPETAPEAAALAGEKFDPERLKSDKEYNVKLGRAYFGKMLEDFGDERLAVAAYNAGPGRIRSALSQAEKSGGIWEDFIPEETKGYLRKVFGAATGGRIERASGGRIMNHKSEAERLMNLADKAKKALNNSTESLLAVPDEAVTKALSIANEAI